MFDVCYFLVPISFFLCDYSWDFLRIWIWPIWVCVYVFKWLLGTSRDFWSLSKMVLNQSSLWILHRSGSVHSLRALNLNILYWQDAAAETILSCSHVWRKAFIEGLDHEVLTRVNSRGCISSFQGADGLPGDNRTFRNGWLPYLFIYFTLHP